MIGLLPDESPPNGLRLGDTPRRGDFYSAVRRALRRCCGEEL